VTENFLNNPGSYLKSQGVQPGKTCLSTRLWKAAFDAAQKGDLSKSDVPKVYLHASHDKALDDLSYRELKDFEAPREVGGLRGRRDEYESPENAGGVTNLANATGGDHGTTAPGQGEKIAGKRTEAA
jgi:uncharacterized protein